MKTLIINPAQLKAINESEFVCGGTASTPDAMVGTVKDILTKDSNVPGVTFAGPGTGMPITADEKTPQTAINNASTITYMNTNKGNVGTTFSESRFSKQQVELARLLEMRKNGKVYTKKQLNEMFMETQENAYIFDEFFNGSNKKPIRKILDGVKECFPEGFDDFLEAVKNGADIPTYIKENFFTSVNSDAEEKFLKKIGAIK